MSRKPIYSDPDKQRLVILKSDTLKRTTEPFRSEWRRDYARLVHSAAFRRLQGKTQLFPNQESDFYRNRLTHSLEVAQIAKSIAEKINYQYLSGRKENEKLNLDIVEFAALAHDLGHPPFGHNGEEALDEEMREYGGFEGNAQTLRILTKLEKKVTQSYSYTSDVLAQPVLGKKDNRAGLNLTSRILAAVLKYDYAIPIKSEKRLTKYKKKAPKGFYFSEKEIVEQIKKNVLNGVSLSRGQKFKTIECQIMDIADDIAYSTYDLEDAFKAGFLDPLEIVSADASIIRKVTEQVKEQIEEQYKNASKGAKNFDEIDAIENLVALVAQVFNLEGLDKIEEASSLEMKMHIASVYKTSKSLASDGYNRISFTSELIGGFIEGVKFEEDRKNPQLSKVQLDIDVFKRIETLKRFTFQYLVMSPRLKVAEYRGKEIVKQIFKALEDDKKNGYLLMPTDCQKLYLEFKGNKIEQKRVICDFIAGMTDRYALEFYNRLFGTHPETIHKPF